ncbi:MAG: hypothetical protein V3T72_14005 [Thermoanaerobaculia bacterium]
MTCPDWRLLSSRRDRDPDAWERGLEHFDGCGRCRDRALAEEPTLMFRRLPSPAVGSDEIAAMKQAVAVLRRSSERRAPAVLRRPSMLRAAALAALVIGAAALQGAGREANDAAVARSPSPGGAVETLAVETLALETLALETLALETLAVETLAVETLAEIAPRSWSAYDRQPVEDLPLIEAADPSYGSVVQVVDDEISLVLVLLQNDV